MAEHVFISANGQALPRWREAFPDGRVSALINISDLPEHAMVWLRLPRGQSASTVLEGIRKRLAFRSMVVLSDIPDDGEALACFAAGARGYCNSHALAEVLRQVATVVGQGGLWIGESLMGRLLQGAIPLMQNRLTAPNDPEDPEWSTGLTERERQVALAVASGASNKEIARQLAITERTVKAHIGAIFDKLGVRDRLQLSLRVNSRHR